MSDKIRIGISSCLLGEMVRFDGGHQLDRYLRDTLGSYFDYVPVCPEVELGLPTPRETLRLVEAEDGTHLVFSRSGEDLTVRMLAWAEKRARELERENLCGFIFKAKSPSSGMERVKLYDRNGVPAKKGVGLFARTFMAHFPLVPVEEDGRMHDAHLRENFIECVFVFKRWRDLRAKGATPAALVEFHTRHKLLLLSHSTELYREMGKLVARSGSTPAGELFDSYQELLMK
ncbi:MAG: YbgA family protein, partial [Desulfuromonadales bacterium]